ncbi:MAG TPA: hypothetical protein VF898_11070 [Chloroflexota bacterium]
MSRSALKASSGASTHDPIATAGSAFTHAEVRALEALRLRYAEDHDLFSRQELSHLRFLRWRARTERLVAP